MSTGSKYPTNSPLFRVEYQADTQLEENTPFSLEYQDDTVEYQILNFKIFQLSSTVKFEF